MRARVRSLTLVALAAAVAALAGCGGDDSSSKAPGSAENPLVASSQESAPTAARSNEAAAPTSADGAAADGTAADGGSADATPGYEKLLDRQTSKPRGRFTPCNLVSKAKAADIVGYRLEDPLEAPQGPTCIYRGTDHKRMVTVAVQSTDFAKLKPRLRQPRTFEIAGRTAYCGQYGQQVLVLPLSDGRVLNIAGPCAVARRFAVEAMRQLRA